MITANTQLVKTRAQGFQIMTPLKTLVDSIAITDEESYLEADAALGRIRNARALWKTKMAPILDPLKRAIDEAKLAMEGAKKLHKEVDDPMEQLELSTKAAMRDFKLLEAAQIRERKALEDEVARKLREREAELSRRELEAKTATMRARLAQQRAEVEAQAQAAEIAVEDIKPVKGASSSSRTVEKCRIKDLGAFLRALEDYEPSADIYKKGHPPLSLIDVRMLQVALNRIFSGQPGIVASWPGIEIFDDVTIAGR